MIFATGAIILQRKHLQTHHSANARSLCRAEHMSLWKRVVAVTGPMPFGPGALSATAVTSHWFIVQCPAPTSARESALQLVRSDVRDSARRKFFVAREHRKCLRRLCSLPLDWSECHADKTRRRSFARATERAYRLLEE